MNVEAVVGVTDGARKVPPEVLPRSIASLSPIAAGNCLTLPEIESVLLSAFGFLVERGPSWARESLAL